MIDSDMWKYKESIYRQTIIDRDNEIYRLKQEIETLKNKQKVYTGFHATEGEKHLVTAFTKVKYNLYD